jgi:transcriptional regulator with XRE-family HTH domain
MDNFSEWLKNELESRGWKQADLVREANLDSAVISNIINGKRRSGENTARAIAHAFKLPPETVFRAAGLLPPQSPETEFINQIIHLTSELPTQEQQDILEFIKLRHRLAEKRGKNETKRTAKRPATT